MRNPFSIWFVFWNIIDRSCLKINKEDTKTFLKVLGSRFFSAKFLLSFSKSSSNRVSSYVLFYIVFLCSKNLKKGHFSISNYAIDFFSVFSHSLSQETNKLANEIKNLFQEVSNFTRTSSFNQFGYEKQVFWGWG